MAGGDESRLIQEAIHAAGITHVGSVPDINLIDLVELLEADPEIVHVSLNREEEGVGVATGVYLGGGFAALLVQNAGLLNACNALTTTALQFEIPILLLVWYAGHLGDNAFMRLGEVTEPVLEALGIRSFIPADAAAARTLLPKAATLARMSARPVAVLLTKAVLPRFAP